MPQQRDGQEAQESEKTLSYSAELGLGESREPLPPPIDWKLSHPTLAQILTEHEYREYYLRGGCACGWGTVLSDPNTAYSLWVDHICGMIAKNAASEPLPSVPAEIESRQLQHPDNWWWEIINGAIGQWGGPQRKHFDEALARIKFVYDERLAGRDEFGNTIELASLPVGESTPTAEGFAEYCDHQAAEWDSCDSPDAKEMSDYWTEVAKLVRTHAPKIPHKLGLGESREPLPLSPSEHLIVLHRRFRAAWLRQGDLTDPEQQKAEHEEMIRLSDEIRDLELPSVPAEIESQMINLRELAATAFRENGHSHAGMGELLGCQDCADIQSAGIKLTNTMRDWLPKLLADSTHTQEKPSK